MHQSLACGFRMSAIEIILYTALIVVGVGFICYGLRLQMKEDKDDQPHKWQGVRGIKRRYLRYRQLYKFNKQWRQDVKQAVMICLGFLFLLSYVFISSPWSVGLTARHLLAAPNCAAARMAGLAPSVEGAPGYYSRHDADADGIACEPFPH